MQPLDTPPQPLAYFTEPAKPLTALVRSLGVLAIVFGSLNLVFLVFNVAYWSSQASSNNYPGYIRISSTVVYPCVTALLSFCLLVGGSGFLRRNPRGKRWLVVWAWTFVAWTVYGVAMNGWFMYFSKLYSPLTFVTSFGYVLERSCGGLSFPLVVIVLMRHEPVRQLFEEDRQPGAASPL